MVCPKIGATFSSNSRWEKLSKKYPRLSPNTLGAMINTPSILVLITSILTLEGYFSLINPIGIEEEGGAEGGAIEGAGNFGAAVALEGHVGEHSVGD